MAVHIRLARAGTKKRPFYRVVVTDQRSPRGGRFLENIGTFDPLRGEASIVSVNDERLAYWRSVGAQTSETLTRLLKRRPAPAADAAAAAPAPAAKAAKPAKAAKASKK